MESTQEREIRRYFIWSVALKGIISLGEIIAGAAALVIPPAAFTAFIASTSQNELLEEPGDFIAAHVLYFAQHLSLPSGTFIAIYLISRGLIKVGLVAALLKNQLWAYPASLVVLGLFVIYQAYEIVVGYSLFVVAITIFDLIVIYFIWREWGVLRAHLRVHGETHTR